MVIETHSENNSNTDTYLYLYNASGSQIASNDDYSGVFSKITYSIPSEPGTGGGGGNDQSYCSSSGNNSNYEWINRVRVSGTPQLNNTSGNNNGYGNFSSSSWTTLSAGNSYYTRLYPGFSESTYQEYWKVWIDFNQDNCSS